MKYNWNIEEKDQKSEYRGERSAFNNRRLKNMACKSDNVLQVLHL